MNEKTHPIFGFQLLAYPLEAFCLMVLLFSTCTQQSEPPVVLPHEPKQIPTVNPTDLPPPIKAKYLDPDSIAPPKVIPLKYQPKVVPAHPKCASHWNT